MADIHRRAAEADLMQFSTYANDTLYRWGEEGIINRPDIAAASLALQEELFRRWMLWRYPAYYHWVAGDFSMWPPFARSMIFDYLELWGEAADGVVDPRITLPATIHEYMDDDPDDDIVVLGG